MSAHSTVAHGLCTSQVRTNIPVDSLSDLGEADFSENESGVLVPRESAIDADPCRVRYYCDLAPLRLSSRAYLSMPVSTNAPWPRWLRGTSLFRS